MRIQDFFTHKRQENLSQKDKLLIYNKFLQKKQTMERPSFFRRIHTFRYAFSVIMIVVISAGTLHQSQPGFLNTLFLVADTVQAAQVAKIIDVQGNYAIYATEDKERKVLSDVLKNGDTIDLEEWGEMLVQMGENHEVQVIGPAKLELYLDRESSEEKEYRVKVVQWDYLSVESVESPVESKENVAIETPQGVLINDAQAKERIENIPQKNNSTITQEQKTSFVLTIDDQDKEIVDNMGTKDLPVTKVNETKISVIPDNKIAAVEVTKTDSQDTKIELVLAQSEEELEALVEEVLTQTIGSGSISTGVVSTGIVFTGDVIGSGEYVVNPEENIESEIVEKQEESPADILKGKTIEEVTKINEIVKKELSIEEKSHQIQLQLLGPLLEKQMRQLLMAHMQGNTQDAKTYLSSIMSKVNWVYGIIRKDNPYSHISYSSSIKSIELLEYNLARIEMPEVAYYNLKPLSSWLKFINAQQVWLYKDIENVDYAFVVENLNMELFLDASFR